MNPGDGWNLAGGIVNRRKADQIELKPGDELEPLRKTNPGAVQLPFNDTILNAELTFGNPVYRMSPDSSQD